MVVFPPFRLDREQERLWKDDKQLVLRRKPMAILRYLVANPNKLITHDDLLANVWRGSVVSESAVRSHVYELRQVLGEGVIETVIGRGYRFIAQLGAPVVREVEVPQIDPLVVGRDAELAALGAALERARGGRRQICFVTGEPGIGKSTLVRTFVAGLRNVVVARGACFEQHGTPEPYLPIIEALGGVARSEQGAQTLAALVRYAPTFVAQVPNLITDEQQLADVARRAAGGNEARLLRELSEAIESLCSQDPIVLVLEDLHWSDVATIDLLSLLGQRQDRAKLLLIGTSRHAEIQTSEHPLNRVMKTLVARSGALAIQLPKLQAASVQAFVDRRFPGHALPERLTAVVEKITGGTPLFVVSLLEELVARGMIADGTLTVPIEDVEAHRPTSVKQLIDIQLDRLTTTEQRVLEAAAVIGAEFSTSLVAAALELPVENVDEICDALLRRSLFLRPIPEDLYGVTHALVQEVCIDRSSPVRRQRWHRLVAEALERNPRAGEHHQLAKHFDAAGIPERAVPAYLAAARHAGQRYAASDAVSLCARALDLLPRITASRERDELELEILVTMCRQVSSSLWAGAFAGREPITVYKRAVEIARSLGEPSRLYSALTQLVHFYLFTTQYDRSTELNAELEELERTHTIEPMMLHAGMFARGYIAFFRADFATALRLFEQLAPAESNTASVFHPHLPGRALAMAHLACVRWLVGDPDRALAEAREAFELAARSKVPVLNALAHVVLGRLRYLGRAPADASEIESALAASTCDLGLHTEARVFALWGEAQRAPQPLAAIEPHLDAFRKRKAEVSTNATFVALVLIDVLRSSGHLAEARALTDDAIAFGVTYNERAFLPELLRMRGEQRDDRAAAAADYREAIELARATGGRSFEQRAAQSLAAIT